jgi:hypothetical protein
MLGTARQADGAAGGVVTSGFLAYQRRNPAAARVLVARIEFVSQWLFDLARGSELRFRSSVIRDGRV